MDPGAPTSLSALHNTTSDLTGYHVRHNSLPARKGSGRVGEREIEWVFCRREHLKVGQKRARWSPRFGLRIGTRWQLESNRRRLPAGRLAGVNRKTLPAAAVSPRRLHRGALLSHVVKVFLNPTVNFWYE